MSAALNQVIARASTDEAFRARLQSDPMAALAGYELTPEERAALRSGDHEAIQALGVDARVSKIHDPAEPGDAFPQGPWN
jgi:hypothetical protein